METLSTNLTTGCNKNYSSSQSKGHWTDEPCGFVPTNVNSITSRQRLSCALWTGRRCFPGVINVACQYVSAVKNKLCFEDILQ